MTDAHPGPGPAAAPQGDPAAPPDEVGDPLLARAEAVGDLPLAERPAAFDALNRALVEELQALEEA